MARRESVVGRRRYARLTKQALSSARRSGKRLRDAATADGGLPGEVAITDPVMQRRVLEGLEPSGLSLPETERLRKFRADRVGEQF